MEKYLQSVDGVTDIASAIGQGHARFMLTYTVPINVGPQFTSILVGVQDAKIIDSISPSDSWRFWA